MQIEKKLGEGAFAVVYLATLNDQQVALKIPKNNISREKTDMYARNEINVLNNFKNSKYIINLVHYEINDVINHIFMELLGDELYDVLNLYKFNKQKLPIYIVKRFAKQLLSGAAEMAKCGILHNDLKPENILFTKPLGNLFKYTKIYICDVISEKISSGNIHLKKHIKKFYNVLQELILSKANIKIIDFGNVYTKKIANMDKKTFMSARPTRYYISPEILLKSPHWVESDMWSIGCIIYEMLTGSILFNPCRENNMGINSAHIAAIIEVFGLFTRGNLKHSQKYKKYFIGTKHRFNYLIKSNYRLKDLIKICNLSQLEYDFLRPIFIYDIKKRITPSACLKSKWLRGI